MAPITQPLREEHKELFPHVESLRLAGDSIGKVSNDVALAQLNEAYDFLAYHLIPHAQAEDKALYPVVQQVMGARQSTATMSRDHVEVGNLTNELEQLRQQLTQPDITDDQLRNLQRVLYGLYTLVKLHFAKEEEIYLPLLDSTLTADEAQSMFENMEAAAHAAKSELQV